MQIRVADHEFARALGQRDARQLLDLAVIDRVNRNDQGT